jgi:phosphopantothenoylcysteine decarboxylase/phosphopantothenate--cysteine ligase
VTGGIAAYKSAELVRCLANLGADVRVIMTSSAMEFIRPLTLQALSGHPVHSALVDSDAEAGMGHIELARWADVFLIAPATAHCIADLVHGKAASLLGAVYLATPAQVVIAPAMNQGMWHHPANVANMAVL